MASPCDACDRFSQSGQQLTENLNQKKVPKGQQFFFKALQKQKLEIDLGGNCKEEFTFDEANKRYLSHYFPALDKTVYCCPPVFEYKYPEEPSDVIKEAEDGSHASSVDRDYGTLKRTRKGQLAEEMIIVQFWTMLKKYKIPSFIIHGYPWKAKYIKNLTKLSESFQKLSPKGGEIDLLISIPEQCIIVIEVKAVSDASKDNITDVVSKAFSQCGKTFDFLSMIISDLYDGGGGSLQVPVIKTVALPNCERVSAERLYCQSCFTHIVTADDLMNADVLYSWFQQLLKQCSSELESSQHDLRSHVGLIGRLISPASLIQIRTIPDSIRRTVSQITSKDESDQTIWRQLNPSQLSVVLRQEKLLWITGVPGSGKTILGLYKADEIVSDCCASGGERKTVSSQVEGRNTDGGDTSVKGCVLYVINGFSPPFAGSCLLETYRAKITKLLTNEVDDTCEVFIKDYPDLVDCGIERHSLEKSQNLPHLIAKLQDKHAGKVLHIIIEESQMLLKQLDHEKFLKDWKDCVDDKRLGNVWIIQSPFITGTDSCRGSLPRFQMVHLDRIMRMSKQNVDFVNILLNKKYKLGHAVTGNRPIIYRMRCICKDSCVDASYQCFVCHVMRILWMFHTSMVEQGVLRKELLDHHELTLKDAVLISLDELRIATSMLTIFDPLIPYSLNEYPEEGTNRVILSSVRHFTGCESSIVFVDLNSAFYDDCYEMECLTRTLGQLVMLDGGCFDEKEAKYAESVRRLQYAADNGAAEIREIEPSTTEMKTLKELYIKYLEHEKARLREKVAVASSDGFSQRVDEAQIQIEKLTKIQNDAQVWLDGRKIFLKVSCLEMSDFMSCQIINLFLKFDVKCA
ncbi:hypothetical protein BSL78_14517 [Apostichopus japonicus]|uniref:Uncharacterized protein n=1 Tax=Stichopus japonicus TaxID=307972 RepID=A0A2G8KKW8_STIJA|nr:hypothetical protein BSL78_14517 [Apostichopus japonicus]